MPIFRLLLFFVSIVFFRCNSHAQGIGSDIVSGYESRKNNALAILTNFKRADTSRVLALIDVLSTAYIQKQREELIPYLEEAIFLSRRLNYTTGLARCFIWKGHYYRSAKDITNAHVYYDSSIHISKGFSQEILMKCIADANRGKAWIYHEQENYYAALNYFFKALAFYERRDNFTSMNLYTNISNIYSRVNDLPQAIVYAEKNAALAEKDSSKDMKIQAWLNLSEIYLRNNQYTKANTYLNKVQPHIPDPVQIMINTVFYLNKGLIHYKSEQYDSALYSYKQAYQIAAKSSHSINKSASLFYLSKSALKLKKYNLAKKYADENLLLAEEIKSKTSKTNALLNLSDFYHEIGNYKKSYYLLLKANLIKDTLISESNINQINTLAAVYEAEKKEKEILKLQSDKKNQLASVKRKSKLNIILTISSFCLLLICILIFMYYKSLSKISTQQQQLQNQKIIELEKDKQLLAVNSMLKGQEEERSRIAKELHDGIGSLLSGTKLSFINIKDKLKLSAENKIQFEKSLNLLDNTISDLRKVAQNLMPEALVKFGLLDALKDYCNSMQSSSGIKIMYLQFGISRKIDNTAEIFIYRIIQELITNAIKHANPNEIIVQFSMNDSTINITVEDDGNGFSKNKLADSKGSGISNIMYRVHYLNGTTDIISSPGNGTSVNIQLIV